MKIVSWNVNGIRAVSKKGNLEEIFAAGFDIVAIQETKATEDQLDKNITHMLGYESFFDSATSRKGYSGVAVYSKMSPLKVEKGLGIPEMDHEGRMLTLHFKDFIFITCYFPNGGRDEEHFQFKLRYYQEFLKKMKHLEKDNPNIIFCGDLNVAHNEIDLARPKENIKSIGFLPIEREWVSTVEEAGFVDSFRKLYPEKVEYSWWDQKTRSREKNVGWRIDYVFVSKSLQASLQDAGMLSTQMGSDHCPVWIQIKK